jgi:predicted acyltransferase
MTIAAMFLVNNPGDWAHLYPPLAHAAWSGWTLTDCIFPFFLFIVGVSLQLSIANKPLLSAHLYQHYAKLLRRAAIIFFIGLSLNFIPSFDLFSLRIPGVLQRIALTIMLAGVILIFFSWRQQCAWIVAILTVYTSVMLLVPVPDAEGVWGQGVLEPGRDFGAWLDRSIMDGHLWNKSKTWDPEGLFSTLPATVSVLFGVLTGRFLGSTIPPRQQVFALFMFGSICVTLGQVMDLYLMPINKSLWTSSFCIMMTGWAVLVFTVFYYLLDASTSRPLKLKMRTLNLPFTMYGLNALFLFALASLLAKLMGFIQIEQSDGSVMSLQKTLFTPLTTLPISAYNASLLFAILFNLLMLSIAYLMWKKSWFIKV